MIFVAVTSACVVCEREGRDETESKLSVTPQSLSFTVWQANHTNITVTFILTECFSIFMLGLYSRSCSIKKQYQIDRPTDLVS